MPNIGTEYGDAGLNVGALRFTACLFTRGVSEGWPLVLVIFVMEKEDVHVHTLLETARQHQTFRRWITTWVNVHPNAEVQALNQKQDIIPCFQGVGELINVPQMLVLALA